MNAKFKLMLGVLSLGLFLSSTTVAETGEECLTRVMDGVEEMVTIHTTPVSVSCTRNKGGFLLMVIQECTGGDPNAKKTITAQTFRDKSRGGAVCWVSEGLRSGFCPALPNGSWAGVEVTPKGEAARAKKLLTAFCNDLQAP